MIRIAKESDFERIVEIWNRSFPNIELFTKWYFQNEYLPDNTLLYEKNSIICAVTQRIPYSIKNLGEVSYLYGCCTDIKYRNKGIMKELLKYSFEMDIKEKKIASILIPENEPLFAFYDKFGYNPCSFIKKEKVKRESADLSGYEFRKISYDDISDINSIYENNLIDINYVIHDELYWKKQIDLFFSANGRAYCLLKENKLVAYAFLWVDDDIFVQQIFAVDNKQNYKYAICQYILKEFSTAEIEVWGYWGSRNDSPVACIKFYSEDKYNGKRDCYINTLYN